MPLFGVLIGLEEDGEAVLGVRVDAGPGRVRVRGSGPGLLVAAVGPQAGVPPRRGRVSSLAPLADGLLLLNSYEYFIKGKRTAAHDRLLAGGAAQRGWGDCYGHILVATGRAEVCVDPMMNPWDNAAAVADLAGSGRHLHRLAGKATIHGGDGISTNGKVFDEVMRVVHLEARLSDCRTTPMVRVGGTGSSSAPPPCYRKRSSSSNGEICECIAAEILATESVGHRSLRPQWRI